MSCCLLVVLSSPQATPDNFKSELVSFQKVQRTTMLDHLDPVSAVCVWNNNNCSAYHLNCWYLTTVVLTQGDSADGEYDDQEPTSDNGYECCWKAPNALLARCHVFLVARTRVHVHVRVRICVMCDVWFV
jgi:hypothetical protein